MNPLLALAFSASLLVGLLAFSIVLASAIPWFSYVLASFMAASAYVGAGGKPEVGGYVGLSWAAGPRPAWGIDNLSKALTPVVAPDL